MVEFKQIEFFQSWMKDRSLLERALKEDCTGTTLDALKHEVKMAHAQLWKLEGEGAYGLMVTQVRNHPCQRDLFVWLIVGDGFVQHKDFVLERILWYARSQGCRMLRTLAKEPMAQAIARYLPLRPEEVMLAMEVTKNGK